MALKRALLLALLANVALGRVQLGRSACGASARLARAPTTPRGASCMLARPSKKAAAEQAGQAAEQAGGVEAGDMFARLESTSVARGDVVAEMPPRALFAIFGRDHESLEDVRFALHNEHVAYWRSLRGCAIYEAGYFLHPHLQSAAGTLFLVGAESADAARALAADDPLCSASLFAQLHVNEWRRVAEPELDNYLTTPPFLVYCRDKPGQRALRQATRPAHLEWLRASAERIAFVGALLADDERSAGGDGGGDGARAEREAVGSLMLVCGESLEDVQAWAARDPYALSGLFESATVLPWTSLDVVNRALPNCPGPPMSEWWTAEEHAQAPPLFVPTADLDLSQGNFTEDGAWRSSARELQDDEAKEDSAEVERWAESLERMRLGTLRPRTALHAAPRRAARSRRASSRPAAAAPAEAPRAVACRAAVHC